MMAIFQFVTIGYNLPKYEPISLEVASRKEEEVIVEIKVIKE